MQVPDIPQDILARAFPATSGNSLPQKHACSPLCKYGWVPVQPAPSTAVVSHTSRGFNRIPTRSLPSALHSTLQVATALTEEEAGFSFSFFPFSQLELVELNSAHFL